MPLDAGPCAPPWVILRSHLWVVALWRKIRRPELFSQIIHGAAICRKKQWGGFRQATFTGLRHGAEIPEVGSFSPVSMGEYLPAQNMGFRSLAFMAPLAERNSGI